MNFISEITSTVRDVLLHENVGEQMSGFDAAAVRAGRERRILRSTIVSVLLLDTSPDWDRLRDRYERMTRAVPEFRKRMVFGSADVLMPRLVVDPDYDLDLHLSRGGIREGGDWQDVLEEARRMSLMDFDLSRPLWEARLLEGLPGGQAALILKLHHSLTDGERMAEMGANWVELTRDGNPDEPELARVPQPQRPQGAQIVVANMIDVARGVTGTAAHGAKRLLTSLKQPRTDLRRYYDVTRSIGKATAIPSGPMSTVMSDRATTYSFRTMAFPFEPMKELSKATEFSVNDEFLAACSTGMAEYHERHGAEAPELRFMVPVSLRRDPSTQREGMHTQVAFARFPLPVTGVSIEERLAAVKSKIEEWRDEPALAKTHTIMSWSWLVPAWVLAKSGTATDVLASNVPGLNFPYYIAGAKATGSWPLVATGGAAANITMATYDGTVYVGVAMDDAAVADPDVFMADLAAGFEEVTGAPVTLSDPMTADEESLAS